MNSNSILNQVDNIIDSNDLVHKCCLLFQFFSEYSYPEKVRFRNEESVNKLIQQLIHNGHTTLQVNTNFKPTSRPILNKLNQSQCLGIS